jgi:hypothetical protein
MWTVGRNNMYNRMSKVVEKAAMDASIQEQMDTIEDANDKSFNMYDYVGEWDIIDKMSNEINELCTN